MKLFAHLLQIKDFVNSNAPNVTKVLAVAAVSSLQWAVPDHKLGIKWPNDIVGNGHLEPLGSMDDSGSCNGVVGSI